MDVPHENQRRAQSRGNLVSVQIDILFGEKPAEKMDRGQHMSQRRGDFFILNENPTQCRGMADFVNPLPGGGHPDPLTNTSHPPPPPPRPIDRMFANSGEERGGQGNEIHIIGEFYREQTPLFQ